MNTGRSTQSLFASIFFLLLPSTLAFAADRDPATSAVYLDQARALYASGDFAAAQRMAESSLQFFPDSSEALYLSARISLRSQENTRKGIESLRKAIAADTWSTTNPDTASQELAGVLVRIGSLAEAVLTLQRLVAREPEDPENILLLAEAFSKNGRGDLAEKTAAAGLKQFPKTEGLSLLSSRLAEARGNLDAARSFAAAGLRELPDSMPLLLRSAVLEPDPERRVRAVDDYLSRGGKEPLAPVLGMEAGPKDPEKYLSAFIANGGLSRLDLTRRVALATAGASALASSFQAELARFTGRRDLDIDGDGFYEERWQYQNGTPVMWIRDANEDGIPEHSAAFSSGAVASLTVPSGGAKLTFHYETYPFLDTAAEADAAETRTYSLASHSLGCPLLDSATSGLPEPEIRPQFIVPTRGEILTAAFREEDYPAGSSLLLRRIDLAAGQRQYMEEDLNRDGVMDHKVWYTAGHPVRGLRDLPGSGGEVSETYRDGKLSGIRADTDGDGKVDYAERYSAATVRLWDYNEDGVWDAREFPGAKGTIVREFSTALNGAFNLRTVFQNGRIVGVQKNGKTLPVAPDKAKGIVWIGPPSPSAPVSGSTRDGVFSSGGKSFLVFRFENIVYVEVIE